MGYAAESFTYTDFHNHPVASQTESLSDASAKLSSHVAPPVAVSGSSYHYTPVPDTPIPVIGFLAAGTMAERVIASQSYAYFRYAGGILVRYRKSNLFFPFHNFW